MMSLSAPTLFLVYIFLCFLLAGGVWGIGRMRAKSDAPSDLANVAERAGDNAFAHLFVLGGTALMALIGWRIPAEIERIYGAGASFGLIFPDVKMSQLGKLAQVVGAGCFGFVAVRLLRIIVPLAVLVTAIIVLILALEYVFEVRIVGLAI